MPNPASWDYVIVGAGSAGCVLANRLSEDPSTRVLLLEAGPTDKKREIQVPAAFSRLFHTDLDWNYHTVPQRHLDDRVMYWPRGKVLGGSSSLNAMMWVRGVPADYDLWAAGGNPGWSYDEIVPYFKRAEDTERHDPQHTGRGGPVTVQEQRYSNPATHMFVEACLRAGIPRNLNGNAGTNEGVDFTQVTQINGRRLSSADAYLRPAMNRPNLTVLTHARATKIEFRVARAVAINYLRKGQMHTARAEQEIILAGGAINSPQLLLLSGIGPASDLQPLGVSPVVDLPGVGRNLMDHLAAGAVRFTTRTDSLISAETLRQLFKYLARRRGMLTSNVGEAHAFLRSSPDLELPDYELLFAPVPFLDHGDTVPPGHGYTIGVILLQPKSAGTIRLASPNPLSDPLIDPNYMADSDDMRVMSIGLQRALEVFDTSPLADVVGEWMRPEKRPDSLPELAAGVRRYAETLYHPAGTCRMGVDEQAVVDPQLRVHGVQGLRVADASVMPSLIRGHTNAPAIMIGEKAADLIRAG